MVTHVPFKKYWNPRAGHQIQNTGVVSLLVVSKEISHSGKQIQEGFGRKVTVKTDIRRCVRAWQQHTRQPGRKQVLVRGPDQ